MTDSETEYWFNTKTNQVEVGKQSFAIYRIGPFGSRAEAEQALNIVADKSKDWKEADDRDY
jgi:cell division septation protein DedD